MRRASTGVSPLLRLWLPSPEVAVKGLAVRGKSVHQSHRVATLFVVTSVNREGDTPVPPHWHATRTPHTTDALPESTLKEGCKPLGFVAYPMFLRSVITHRIHNLSPKFAWSRRSAAAQRAPCCSRTLASSSCASHSTFVPEHLPKGPACLRCVAHSAAVGRELKGMSYRLHFGPQGWESMARAADQSASSHVGPSVGDALCLLGVFFRLVTSLKSAYCCCRPPRCQVSPPPCEDASHPLNVRRKV